MGVTAELEPEPEDELDEPLEGEQGVGGVGGVSDADDTPFWALSCTCWL